MSLSREQLAEKIMVALDYPTAKKAEQLIQQLKGIPCYLKVGMQLFYAEGPGIVVQLKEQGYKVFLDLKLHDIPNTVKGAAESLTRLGIDMFNVHAGGGRAMMEAAREGMERVLGSGQTRPLLIGVTQLTSTSREVLNKEIGIGGTVEEVVLHYAGLARKAGLDGVVASPLEVGSLKETFGPSIITVTPGIRPRGIAIGDQTRIMTPEEAIHAGTDYMVIGRPITAAPEPREAMESILDSLLD